MFKKEDMTVCGCGPHKGGRTMSLKDMKKMRSFHNFDEAAEHILHMLSKQMNINTLFIAKNDGVTNKIVKAVNAGEELVQEGSSSPLEQTFCSLSINYGEEPLKIGDISKSKEAGKLPIASRYNNGSFMGIPIYYENGDVYGTICGLDNQPFDFTEEHQNSFEMMSALLTYVLELEKANEQIQSLSSPLVPVTKGVSILPVIGHITPRRAQAIIEDVLEKCSGEMDYLIIDVSGVTHLNAEVGKYLLMLVSALKIIGVAPVITGIQPFMALKVPHFASALKGEIIEANLEMALSKLGFVLKRESK